MPDSQSSEPGFESPFATVSKIGHFRSLHCGPSWLSCINEYLAIDSGGHVSDLVLARNCCLTRMLPGEAELVSEWTGLPGKAKSVKRFERSNGLDTALYKNYLFFYFISGLLLGRLSGTTCYRVLQSWCSGSLPCACYTPIWWPTGDESFWYSLRARSVGFRFADVTGFTVAACQLVIWYTTQI